MQFGENPNKVQNIVTDKNAEAFRLMYSHSCSKLQHLLRLDDGAVVQVSCGFYTLLCPSSNWDSSCCYYRQRDSRALLLQDTGRAARQDLLLRLPSKLKANIERQTGQSLVDLSTASAQVVAGAVANGISTIVKSSSRSQSLKGTTLGLNHLSSADRTTDYPYDDTGILTAGLIKTMVYSANKIAKMRKTTKHVPF
jgi:hypothetical protein